METPLDLDVGGLEQFFSRVDTSDQTLVVCNRTAPDPIQRMLGGLFERTPVEIEEREASDLPDDMVLLIEDGSVIANDPLSTLTDQILLINSDLFKTGARDLEDIELPSVLTELDDTPFRLRGYPESHKEKLLLICLSRHIERLAWTHADGTLRASFQRLSRIADERGTKQVYETIANTDCSVHLYGLPDWIPPAEFNAIAHTGYSSPFRRSWFVCFESADGETSALLLALQSGPNEWAGFWTFRADLVEDVSTWIQGHL